MRLYEASLCWFVHTVRPLKIMVETTKSGERLLYGGLPISSFESLVKEERLPESRSAEYGYAWDLAGHETEKIYPPWRQTNLDRAVSFQSKNTGENHKEVISRIRTFDLVRATPMQALLAVSEWQELLREPGKEGA